MPLPTVTCCFTGKLRVRTRIFSTGPKQSTILNPKRCGVLGLLPHCGMDLSVRLCLACGHRFVSPNASCPACGNTPRQESGFRIFGPELLGSFDGYDSSLAQFLVTVEDGSFWFRSRNRLILWASRFYFQSPASFFEVGCGPGFVLRGFRHSFPETQLYGSEAHIASLRFCRERVPEAQLFQMNAERIPFIGEFELVGAFDVLEHIRDDQRVLAQIHQALKPGGGIILTAPHHRFLWGEADERAGHIRRYGLPELREKVKSAGFQVLRTTAFMTPLVAPLLVVARFKLQRRISKDPVIGHRLPRGLSLMLERILDAERHLIARGLNFHFGTSVFLVGRRPD